MQRKLVSSVASDSLDKDKLLWRCAAPHGVHMGLGCSWRMPVEHDAKVYFLYTWYDDWSDKAVQFLPFIYFIRVFFSFLISTVLRQ